MLDSNRLLFDLQRATEIVQSFSGCLKPEEIACCITDGLVEKFEIAFARIWLLEPDQMNLRLVASSGIYTHLNGSFARVPMGAYKVGKIAQNRVSFLSNNLADESWVKDREWAIALNIRGFAGYPLLIGDRVVGVLATFSHQAMAPEFLEILQTICATGAVVLDTALQYQTQQQNWQANTQRPAFSHLALSDQLAGILRTARLTLIGTEQPLSLPLTYLFLRSAEMLHQLGCSYCRLIYQSDSVGLEAIVPMVERSGDSQTDLTQGILGDLMLASSHLGGSLQMQTGADQKATQFSLKIPYPSCPLSGRVYLACRQSVLQMAFTHLAQVAGFTISTVPETHTPCLTDDVAHLSTHQSVVWIQTGNLPIPKGVCAVVDLQTRSTELRAAIEHVSQGKTWGITPSQESPLLLSERELEVMTLLSQGLRDRDIANHLIISESTVKFHINNTLAKLKARTRYQALHKVVVNGWIQ
ncbi:MAG: GAF domain-containing protein [Scytolyngbya sp. HA4215-MV1]|nr:GAF domain-containing protein [Scytolyngbya sp. HA4215-MV1]